MKTYLYFVRHAASPFSLDNELQRGLSEQGQADSHVVAEILKNEEIDLIVSSTYRRAIDTVRPLAERMNQQIILYDGLAERAIASLKSEIPEVELLKAIEESFKDINYCLPEGETTKQARVRSLPIIEKLLSDNKGKKIAIGTHGNIMTIILNFFDPSYGYEFWLHTSKPDIYRLEFEGLSLNNVERLWECH